MSSLTADTRPSRAEIAPAALELVRRHGGQIMSTARRYAASPEDAEDAYQRGLEILLTKAPSTRAEDLVPWLKTVVKHEAWALRKQREKAGLPTEKEDSRPALADTHEQVERLDKLQRGAEAMQRLKPQEMRCMLLLAEGHSYAQIQEITGFSYTKVNRCLAEGRRSFVRRVERIEAGAECERVSPLVSRLADGEASAGDMAVLRPHLRTCLVCRAALRDAREAPRIAAALAPVGVLADLALSGAHGGAAESAGSVGGAEALAHGSAALGSGGGFGRSLHGLSGWLHDRAVSVLVRSQELVEVASAHKLAAVASATALAGGGAAAVHSTGAHTTPHPDRRHTVAHEARPAPVRAAATVVAPRAVPPAPASTRPPRRRAQRPAAQRATAAARSQPPSSPASEFEPPVVAAEAAPAAPENSSPKAATGETGEFGP